MDKRAGRSWLITGTSSGLGRALVQAAAGRGDQVMATARQLDRIADLELLAPGRVRIARLDVTDGASVSAAVAAAEDAFGGIDVLVNNAGSGLLGAFEEHEDEELRAAFETNLFGALAVTRAVLPGMRLRRSGHVVQLSSVVGVTSGPGGAAYAGPKAALEAMSEALAAEVAHLGIRVTIVEPGPFRTDFGGRSLSWGKPLDDYAALIGPARAAFEASHGMQTGDPLRGAEAIVDAVDRSDSPLRLPLGAEAYQWIRGYLRGRLDELEVAEAIGADTALRN
jgi:NAD(P)-dependent dehydrogenase (short-subunit alcohol dehydrogenase family)